MGELEMGEKNRRLSSHSDKLHTQASKKYGSKCSVECGWIIPHKTMVIQLAVTSPNTGSALVSQIEHVAVDSYRKKRDVLKELGRSIDLDLLLGL